MDSMKDQMLDAPRDRNEEQAYQAWCDAMSELADQERWWQEIGLELIARQTRTI